MSNLMKLTLAGARDALRSGQTTAVELTEASLAAVAASEPLNAFVHDTSDIAREQAAAADLRLQGGDAPDMCGLPIGMKDLFCTKGVATQAASAILDGFKPEYESTVSQKLFNVGAVMVGKLNMDEFAMGSSNETSIYGNAVNPWKVDGRELTPGGSSGGSAAAVAAETCLAATGTDTGGSIRQPAAFTGITGIKPTYGRCSRWGIVAFASSLDQAGPITKDVRDAAIMLEAMCGFDPKDSTSMNLPVPNFEAALTGDVRGKTIGIPKEYRVDGMPDALETLWAEGTAMLRDAGGVYNAYYNRARRVRALIKKDFDDAFASGIDAILTPSTPSAAFGLGEMVDADPVQMYLFDVFTVTVNLAGLPGISVPAGLDSKGLPLGLQLIGRPWEEGDLLNTAFALEKALGFNAKPNQWWL
jgi:aspartyl-tRNA(Asn)/glutamyl-tRNA(Gln) amidotransferase subunit A